jgi:hypothetical protein
MDRGEGKGMKRYNSEFVYGREKRLKMREENEAKG